ncbi:RagB/SusD family nutrient uptake outer membrane protein [Mucilaginibacter sp.]|uniref:RagB/SusD family nutrient uptake outer membrane protein n=1 Tax=Mucilaginibacter sp. TaxID=1882438 RepID=UPI002849D081|nr:RagB/SusD family nutrient uptake outer membrane protein [Mucilaginibacter sp.]MDR3693225.1 RagB/SusD family nutrient uptake outer membrane protein [Mucilaginibacter sp.]
MKRINIIVIFLLFGTAIGGCKKSFLNRPSNSQISAATFYTTPAELRLATASLYGGAPWGQWHYNALLQLGDILSGTGYVGYNNDMGQLFSRTITANNGILNEGWTGLYIVIGQCNNVINAIQQTASASIPQATRNAAIAEAKFIRAVAYYHLAVYWNDVPIIEDNSKLIQKPLLYRNTTADVFKFITIDLTYAAHNLPLKDDKGRVTTWSAQGMLAKVYLTMSGWGSKNEGVRNQALLDSAKKYAGNVCKNSGLALLGQDDPSHLGYYNLFRSQYNDNPEALFAFQWSPLNTSWETGNMYLTFSPSNSINPQKNGAWFGLTPTWDLYKMYSADDSIRRKATIMLNGDYYPELNAAGGGFKSTGQSLKKHIIGNEVDNNSPTMTYTSSCEHDAVLRLADVYLVYAEAILGNNATTSDADALTYFNKVRTRAGLTTMLSLDGATILKERRVELAFEGQYWIDLVRLSFYSPIAAVKLLNNQDATHSRETFSYDPTTRIATRDTTTTPTILPATINAFKLQVPASEMTADPKLALPPVPYY